MFASVEIKTLPRPVLALKVIDIVEQHWSRARPLPLISSFDYSTLCVCHQRQPSMPLGYLAHQWSDKIVDEALNINGASIHLAEQAVTKSVIDRVHAAGLAI